MVRNITLAQIHLRLVEIFKPECLEISFAKKHLFLLGELLQVIDLLKVSFKVLK